MGVGKYNNLWSRVATGTKIGEGGSDYGDGGGGGAVVGSQRSERKR